MPDFVYTARDLTGRKTNGRLTAPSRQEALAALDQQALFPLDLAAAPETMARGKQLRVKPALLASMFGQLADLLRGGVPLLRALDVMRKQASNQALKNVLSDLYEQVEQGTEMSRVMAGHQRTFSEMSISIVRAGEKGGFLEESFERLAEFIEKQEDMKARTIGALAYPMLLGGIGVLVVSGLIVFAVPMFEGLFARLRAEGELPLATDLLLGFSYLVQQWWWAIAIVLGVAFVMLRSKWNTDAARTWRDGIKLRLPAAGPIFLNLAVARFCRVLGTLLRNGVPILRSLEISSDAAGNRVLGTAIREAAENISAGESLAAPLASCKQFPPAVVEMITVAEEANTLDTVLIELADRIDKRIWRQLDLFVRLIEPIMLLLLALVVLFVAMALLLPVLKMSSMV